MSAARWDETAFVLRVTYVDVTLAGLECDYRCNRHCETPGELYLGPFR